MTAKEREWIHEEYKAWKLKMLAGLETNDPKTIGPMESEPEWAFFSAALMLELYNGTAKGRSRPREAASDSPNSEGMVSSSPR